MTDRPIIFSGAMVRALLEGRKTQARRALPSAHPRFPHYNQINMDALVFDPAAPEAWYWDGIHDRVGASYPIRYALGDRLWVREAHSTHNAHGTDRSDGKRWGPWSGLPTAVSPDGERIAYYREGFDRCGFSAWRPSIHMPRWASRLTLIVTDVRVQRLQEITLGDICAEGLAQSIYDFRPVQRGFDAFEALWNSLHSPEAWAANPWVAALTFRVIRANIDSPEAAQ